jgi:hypothetical protein
MHLVFFGELFFTMLNFFTVVFLEEEPFFLVAVATAFFLGAVFFEVGLPYWGLWSSSWGLPSLACLLAFLMASLVMGDSL